MLGRMAWLHTVLDLPPERHGAGTRFWSAALGWPAGAPWPGHPELASLEPPDGSAYVHVQRAGTAPRIHLDVGSDDPSSTLAAAVAAGAERVGGAEQWTALRSPGGLPFCVLRVDPGAPPPPVTWPDGHRSRLVQVCLDLPGRRVEREVAFWREVLGGRFVASDAPEFVGKWHDDAGSPLQLLFQRLDEVDGRVRAHLDLGTDAPAAEVRRLLGLGATDVGPGRGGWHVLTDPVGMPFCVTANAPDTTRTRDLG